MPSNKSFDPDAAAADPGLPTACNFVVGLAREHVHRRRRSIDQRLALHRRARRQEHAHDHDGQHQQPGGPCGLSGRGHAGDSAAGGTRVRHNGAHSLPGLRSMVGISKQQKPIGIFDSGVGGLTVLKALRERLPDEHFVYLGDTARLPYGIKSPGSVLRYARQAAAHLEARDVKLLVIACNTASAVALADLREALDPLPVIGVIEPPSTKTPS